MRSRARWAALACALPAEALAHGFGERYDLPAPLGYFVVGAAATVLATFLVAVIGVRRPRALAASIASWRPGMFGIVSGVLLRAAGVAALLLVIAAGFWGEDHPAKNIAPTIVWIFAWVGLSLMAGLVADVWPAIDPWRLIRSRAAATVASPPGWLPVALFLAFAWIEVVDPVSSRPSHLATLLVAWTIAGFVGMRRYGGEAWRARGDPLSLYFATLGRFAPFAADSGRIVLRPWGRGLLTETAPVAPAFVIAMLATVLFDGLLGTVLWRSVDTAFTRLAPALNDRNGVVLGTLGLAATFAIFLLAYRLACRLTAAIAPGQEPSRIAALFSMTLVPIAVAYLVAHNFSYLLVQGQGIWSLASDPFGRGWNLFGTAGHTPDIGLIGARTGWYIAIGAIVIGHVISVWLAHRVALSHWPTAREAILASIPLTALMVGYTAVSLVVVAEPMSRYSKPDESYSSAPPAQSTRKTSTIAVPVDPAAPVTITV